VMPSVTNSLILFALQLKKVQEMVSPNRAAIVTWEERIAQARMACEAWKQEAEESKIKATIASQQRDEVI